MTIPRQPTVKISLVSEPLAEVFVNVHLISIVVGLENLVMLQDPVVLLSYVGTQHTGGCGTSFFTPVKIISTDSVPAFIPISP